MVGEGERSSVNTPSNLIAHWKAEGISIASGNAEAALVDFEVQNAVRLPSDLRQYFALADGMPRHRGSDCDRNGFSFWPLSEVKPVPVVCASNGIPLPEGEHLDRYFVFADYLQWSWAYAIDLSGPEPKDHTVIHVGTLRPKVVARSFGHFVELYLRNALELYVVDEGQPGYPGSSPSGGDAEEYGVDGSQ